MILPNESYSRGNHCHNYVSFRQNWSIHLLLQVCVITLNPGNTCLCCADWFILSDEISPYHGFVYTIGRFAQGIFLVFHNVAFAWCRWMKICLHTDRCIAGIILGIGSYNKRRCYNATSSLIGWAHTHNNLCIDVWTRGCAVRISVKQTTSWRCMPYFMRDHTWAGCPTHGAGRMCIEPE